jgi:hypothetical protein
MPCAVSWQWSSIDHGYDYDHDYGDTGGQPLTPKPILLIL